MSKNMTLENLLWREPQLSEQEHHPSSQAVYTVSNRLNKLSLIVANEPQVGVWSIPRQFSMSFNQFFVLFRFPSLCPKAGHPQPSHHCPCSTPGTASRCKRPLSCKVRSPKVSWFFHGFQTSKTSFYIKHYYQTDYAVKIKQQLSRRLL